MRSKDATQKDFFNHADVFADIFDGIIYHGEERIDGTDLQDELPRSAYQAKGDTHLQERDVIKYLNEGALHLVLLGIENENEVNPDMPIRIISYDAAEYRWQLKKENTQKERWPVISLVLYFGEKPWDGPTSLKECLTIPEKLKGLEEWISDYAIHVVDVPRLKEQEIDVFHSDFRIVAEYLSSEYYDRENRAADQKFDHAEDAFRMMREITNEERFLNDWEDEEEQEGEGVTMRSKLFDRIEEQGRQKGIQEGHQEGLQKGRQEGLLFVADNLFDKGFKTTEVAQMTGLTLQQAEEREKQWKAEKKKIEFAPLS